MQYQLDWIFILTLLLLYSWVDSVGFIVNAAFESTEIFIACTNFVWNQIYSNLIVKVLREYY